jgi:hypothetical protein
VLLGLSCGAELYDAAMLITTPRKVYTNYCVVSDYLKSPIVSYSEIRRLGVYKPAVPSLSPADVLLDRIKSKPESHP